MRIAFASDIHREKGKQPHSLVVPDDTDVLVLAGDIHLGEHAIPWIIETFGSELPIVYVPGNHEFWYGVYQHTVKKLREDAALHPNLHLLMEDTVVIDGWTFMGTTAWTDLELGGKPLNETRKGTNDYDLIQWREPGNSYRKITVRDTLALNERAQRFIWHELGAADLAKCIVVTHHAPTPLSIASEFSDNPKNAFYVNMWGNRLAYGIGPKYWFHGHTHAVLDYEIGETRVLCNPVGYPHENTLRAVTSIDA